MSDEELAEAAYIAYSHATLEPGMQVGAFNTQNEDIKFGWLQAVLAVKDGLNPKQETQTDAVEEK